MRARNSIPLTTQRGASLVSLMVGLVISMLVVLSAMGSWQFFSTSLRQSVSLGSTLGQSTTASAIFKHELAQAGRGLVSGGAPICATVNLSLGQKLIADNEALAPLEVSRSEEGELMLDIRYAQALEASTAVLTRSELGPQGTQVELQSLLPAQAGQTVLVAPPEQAGAPAGTCTVRTITALSAPSGTAGQVLSIGAAGAHNQKAFTSPQTYPEGSRVFLMGRLEHVQFQHKGDQLVMRRPLSTAGAAGAVAEVTLASRVRAFEVQLGVDDGINNTLSEWTRAQANGAQGLDWSVLTSARLAQVLALRVGWVLLDPQRSTDCTSSSSDSAPTLFGEKVSMEAQDACYKHRSTSMVVPLRNIHSAGAGA